MGYRCLFCYTDLLEDRVVIKSEDVDLKYPTSPVLEQQLKVIFILRKLLEIPEVNLIRFLKGWGKNPSEWIRLCQQCEETVENAHKIYEEILEVQRRFRGVQQKVIEMTKESCYGDVGCGKERMTSRDEIPEVPKDSVVMAVTNECRAIIRERAAETSVFVDNSFIEGDLMAETAVIAAEQKTGLIEDNITIPLKVEIISEDESESILPSDHFDDGDENEEENYDRLAGSLKCIPPKEKSLRSRILSRKPKLKRKVNREHSTVECPVCQSFKCDVLKVEQLCEHLEFCTEEFGNQDEDYYLTCPVCREFKSGIGNKMEFAEHMNWCAEINQSPEAGLKNHESSLLRWKIFSCDTCGEKGKTRYMKIDQFVEHLIHHMRCPFKCTHCSQRFKIGTSQYNFYHYKINHPNFLQPASSRCKFDGDLPIFFWWCPVSNCSEKFTTHILRDEHIHLEHAECCQDIQSRKSVSCGMCSCAFFCEDELRLHNATNHVFMEKEKVERSVQNQERNTKQAHIKTKQKLRTRKILKLKVSSSARNNADLYDEGEERQKNHETSKTKAGYSRKEFQKILQAIRREKERENHTQSTVFCPRCNKFPFKGHQLPKVLDHMETCHSASHKEDNRHHEKKCPVCLVKNFHLETTSVEYVEHVTSCSNKNANDGDDRNCLIPLKNRLFKCTTCTEDEKKWMQVDDFLEHYIYHLRYRFKCTKCSHRFVTNEPKDTHYHYKALHPDTLKEPSNTRCTLELELPELCWWCPVCSEKFCDEDQRNIHFDQHHLTEYSDLKINTDKYVCQWCSKTAYFCADELRYHQGTRHVYDEKKRMGRDALKYDGVRTKSRTQKPIPKKPPKPKRSHVEACFFKPASSFVGPTALNTKPVVVLSPSSSEFFTKLQFRQFLKKHFGQLNETDIPQQNYNRFFPCKICPDREAMDLATFLDHYLFHKRKIFKCTRCSHRFPSNLSQDTNYHYKMIHPEHANEPNSTRCVEDAVLPELIWVCAHCKKEYSSEDLRDHHVETEHEDKLSEEKSELCPFCPKKYSSSEELLIHIGTTHVLVEKLRRKDRRFYKCNECLETFESWGDYKKHCRKVHNVGDVSKNDYDEEGPDLKRDARVICDVCGAEVKNNYLKRHLKLHRRTKKFHCQVPGCGESFTTNEYLGLHKFRKHESRDPGKNPLVCPYCPAGEKVLHNRYYLRRHIQAMHHKKFNLQCDICGKGFIVKSQLMRHLSRFHQIGTLGQLKCSVEGCRRIFYRKELLEEHLSKHNEKPKYKCRFCGKEIYFRKVLQRHELIHTNAESRPYQCEICAKRFPVKNYLYIHMRSHKRKGEVKGSDSNIQENCGV